MEKIISSVRYVELSEVFYKFFIHELGHAKFMEVYKKVKTSNKIQTLLYDAKRDRIKLGTNDYLITLHSSTSFVFSKAEIIFLASVMVLGYWEDQIGKPNQFSDDIYMNRMFFELVSKCEAYKIHTSSSPNFFGKLCQFLNDIFSDRQIINLNEDLEESESFERFLCDQLQEEYDEIYDEDDEIPLESNESTNELNKFYTSPFISESQRESIANNPIFANKGKPAYFIRGTLYCPTCHVTLDELKKCIKCKGHFNSYGKRI